MTVLFSVKMPKNATSVLIMIMQLINLDLVDETVMQETFGFTPTAPFNAIFWEAGFDTTTFWIEIGPILLIVFSFGVFVVLRELLRYIFKKYPMSNSVVDFIKKKIKKIKYKVIIVRFLLEGCIELGLSALICVLSLGDPYTMPDGASVEEATEERRML